MLRIRKYYRKYSGLNGSLTYVFAPPDQGESGDDEAGVLITLKSLLTYRNCTHPRNDALVICDLEDDEKLHPDLKKDKKLTKKAKKSGVMLHQIPEHFICSTSCSFSAEVPGLVSVTITCLLIVDEPKTNVFTILTSFLK
ncbi:hypothetical protein Pelo_6853 [Pelomyxa schiedti]|nr:hypothetical protein Pelo_6853 [Pelomyxa schiedti]